MLKVMQLYDTQLVRHGIMLTGPSGSGKSRVFDTLLAALNATAGVHTRMVVLNPKAFRMQDMYVACLHGVVLAVPLSTIFCFVASQLHATAVKRYTHSLFYCFTAHAKSEKATAVRFLQYT